MSTTNESCGTCRFWLQSDNLCRRFPATPVLVPKDGKVSRVDRIISHFPTMMPIGWCGEWKA